ncbi:hypothetical protein P3T20_001461 [Paraburkholderia sp. GAS206C]
MNVRFVSVPAILTAASSACARNTDGVPARSTITAQPHDQSANPVRQACPEARQCLAASTRHTVTRTPRLTASLRAYDNVERRARARASTWSRVCHATNDGVVITAMTASTATTTNVSINVKPRATRGKSASCFICIPQLQKNAINLRKQECVDNLPNGQVADERRHPQQCRCDGYRGNKRCYCANNQRLRVGLGGVAARRNSSMTSSNSDTSSKRR